MCTSDYNAPSLRFSVCLLPHEIGALQGIGSIRFKPVERLGVRVLSGVPFA